MKKFFGFAFSEKKGGCRLLQNTVVTQVVLVRGSHATLLLKNVDSSAKKQGQHIQLCSVRENKLSEKLNLAMPAGSVLICRSAEKNWEVHISGNSYDTIDSLSCDAEFDNDEKKVENEDENNDAFKEKKECKQVNKIEKALKSGQKVVKIDKENNCKIEKKNSKVATVGMRRSFPNGLKYEIMSVSNGKASEMAAVKGRRCRVRYDGRLASTGRKFDNGVFEFTLGFGEVVEGFDIGVNGMLVGEKRKVFIPSKLGYGARGAPPAIPKNADLVFEITLLNVK